MVCLHQHDIGAVLHRIGQFVHAVEDGPAALVLEGLAGIGKTAIWQQAALGASACVYGQLPSPGIVTVNVVPSVGKAGFEKAREMKRVGKPEDVAGLGDGAFAALIGPAASIEFYRGDTLVVVGVVSMGPNKARDPKDLALTLAKLTLGRM